MGKFSFYHNTGYNINYVNNPKHYEASDNQAEGTVIPAILPVFIPFANLELCRRQRIHVMNRRNIKWFLFFLCRLSKNIILVNLRQHSPPLRQCPHLLDKHCDDRSLFSTQSLIYG